MRVVAGFVGLLALAAVWNEPARVWAGRSFAIHMLGHMTLVAVAAPLLAIAMTHPRVDPVRRYPRLFSPIPASLVELVVVWAWHAPALHQAARQSAMLFAAEQASFLASGLLLWTAVFGGDARMRVDRAGASVLALVLTFAHMTMLGAVLALAPRPLYHASHEAASMSATASQQWGGTMMLLIGGVSYLSGALWAGRHLVSASRVGGRGA